jgi:hypothetical protein
MSNIEILLLLLFAFGSPTLLVLGILSYKWLARKMYNKRFANAQDAQARVLSIDTTMVLRDVRGKLKLSLTLEIHILNDHLYTTITTWEIDLTAIAHIQPGQIISVKVDATEKTKIYPNVPWATYWL